MKKQLNLHVPSRQLNFIDKPRNAYCKSHCGQIERLECRNVNQTTQLFLCCAYGMCSESEPLTGEEITSLLDQMIQQTITDEQKQQEQQKIKQMKEQVTKQINDYCDSVCVKLDDYLEKQTQTNQIIKQNKEEQNGYNINQISQLLCQQEIVIDSPAIKIVSQQSKNFNNAQKSCIAKLNHIQQIFKALNDNYDDPQNNVLKANFDLNLARFISFEKQHKIYIQQQQNSQIRIYQDLKNELIIAASTGSNITLIKPNRYSLFGSFTSIKQTIQPDIFCVSPSGEYYAWGSNSKCQIYDTNLKTQIQIIVSNPLDTIAFSQYNELVVCTSDKVMKFYEKNQKDWNTSSDFCYMPERIINCLFIEEDKKLVCQSLQLITLLIKDEKNWCIHQQIQQSFNTIVWSHLYQFLITLNYKSQIQVWQKNKRNKYCTIQTQWKPDLESSKNDILQTNLDGNLLFQVKNAQAYIYQILEDGQLIEIFNQIFNQEGLIMLKDFTNLVSITNNSSYLEWYQITEKQE